MYCKQKEACTREFPSHNILQSPEKPIPRLKPWASGKGRKVQALSKLIHFRTSIRNTYFICILIVTIRAHTLHMEKPARNYQPKT